MRVLVTRLWPKEVERALQERFSAEATPDADTVATFMQDVPPDLAAKGAHPRICIPTAAATRHIGHGTWHMACLEQMTAVHAQ